MSENLCADAGTEIDSLAIMLSELRKYSQADRSRMLRYLADWSDNHTDDKEPA